MQELAISDSGRQLAAIVAKRFGIPLPAALRAQALFEQAQAQRNAPAPKTNDAMNKWIRAAAGYAPIVQEQDQADAPRKLPTANAGAGARQQGPDLRTTSEKMNAWIRGAR